MADNTHKYDDIIMLPHPSIPGHPRMARENRAAQFAPFAALTGYEEAVKEAGRLTDRKMILDEDEKTILDGKLQRIAECIADRPRVTVTYFQPDGRKAGGSYVDVTGRVRRLDQYEHLVLFTDGTAIPIGDISEITGPIFAGIF